MIVHLAIVSQSDISFATLMEEAKDFHLHSSKRKLERIPVLRLFAVPLFVVQPEIPSEKFIEISQLLSLIILRTLFVSTSFLDTALKQLIQSVMSC